MIGAVAVVGVILVRAVVLDEATYTTALARADAYERVYTEVLADPEVAELKEAMLGDLGVPAQLAVQARALGVNVARWVAPPSTLRTLTEAVIRGVVAYVRGDTPRLDATVAVESIADRVPTTTIREVRALLASAADRTVASTNEMAIATQQLADQLSAGEVPASIPKVGGTTFDPEAVADAILDALDERADEQLRATVTATVLAGDQRDAVITAAAGLVGDHAAAAAATLRAEPTVDVAALVADHADQPVTRVVANFDTLRDIARWFGPWTALAGTWLAVTGAAAILWLQRRCRRVAAWWVGGALVASGVVVIVAWLIVRAVVANPLAPATTTDPAGWRLPPSVAALLSDVVRLVGVRLGGVAWRCAIVLVLAGTALVAGAAVGRLVETSRRAVTLRRLAVLGIGVVVLVGFSIVMTTRPTDERACDGHVELCDRRYDEVTTAATHNAMSSPDVVPVWPEHDGGLTEQLDAGVRTLLIDTHHWPPLQSAAELAAVVGDDGRTLPPALAAALYELRADLREGRPGAFLCHIHCIFGAQPLGEGLGEVRDFLVANPDEVVTLIIQDEIPAVETAAAFDAAGLTPFVYHHGSKRSWPTLGEMIDDGERLVVFAENAGPPPDWYANAFERMQETPFLFLSPDAFSCAENRGDPDAPLFLMNHWIQRIAPDRADSARVNRLDVLVDRARESRARAGPAPELPRRQLLRHRRRGRGRRRAQRPPPIRVFKVIGVLNVAKPRLPHSNGLQHSDGSPAPGVARRPASGQDRGDGGGSPAHPQHRARCGHRRRRRAPHRADHPGLRRVGVVPDLRGRRRRGRSRVRAVGRRLLRRRAVAVPPPALVRIPRSAGCRRRRRGRT